MKITITKRSRSRFHKTERTDVRGGTMHVWCSHEVKQGGEVVAYVERPIGRSTRYHVWDVNGAYLGLARGLKEVRTIVC